MVEERTHPSATGIVPWPDEYVEHYVARGYWENVGLAEHIFSGRAESDTVCLVDGEIRMSYRELQERVDGAAYRLYTLGLRPDDRVVFQLPNCWEFVVLSVACFRLGVVPVMALPAHRHHEVTSVAHLTEAKALIVPDAIRDFEHQAMAEEVAAKTPSVELVMVAGADVRENNVDVRALCEPVSDVGKTRAALDPMAPKGGAAALFLLSGGTTGVPKVIPRTHNDYAYMAKRAAEICLTSPETVYLAVHPLAHGFTMAGPGALGTLMSGGRVVINSSPDPEKAFAAIAAEAVTMTTLVPASIQKWIECRKQDSRFDLSSLRLVQVGGSRLHREVAQEVAPVLVCELQQAYGMSEGLFCLTRPGDPEDIVYNTQGRPICRDDELVLVDSRDEPVCEGEPGLLLTRGPYTPRGYYRASAQTEASFTVGGWYRTGDIARIRADGNIIVEGRSKDVINRGGEKIAAGELEKIVGLLDGINEVAAIGMSDDVLGERVCLYVIPTPGKEVTLAIIHEWLEKYGVAPYKFPEELVLVENLPTTSIGKIDKNALREDLRATREAPVMY